MRELIVGFQTALDFWRSARIAEGGIAWLESEGRIFGARDLTLREQAERISALCHTEGPIDVVAARAAARYARGPVESHVWRGPLGEGWLFRLGDGIAVCRMPVVLAQLGAELSEIDLMRIAYEMTGTYGLAEWADKGMRTGLSPLVDLGELQTYADYARANGVRGASRASDALGWVVPNSNSPRETDVAILHVLPRRRGGLGLGGFRLNDRIELPAALAQDLGRKTLVPDFSWGNGTVTEYDSHSEHDSPEARARDESKRRAYRKAGLDCLTLTKGILGSDQRLNSYALELEESLGVKRRRPTEAILRLRSARREELFGPEATEEALRRLGGGLPSPIW